MAITINRADAINATTDLEQAGIVFNDAVRDSEGLFSTNVEGNQNPFLASYTTDIHAVQNDLTAILAAPATAMVGGVAFTLNATDTADLNNINGQLNLLLTAAPMTSNPATLVAADQTVHVVQQEILGEINNDPHIAAALQLLPFTSNTGAPDVAFQNVPVGAQDPASVALAAAGGNLRDVGNTFNEVTNFAAGGLNADNIGDVTVYLQAVQSGINHILNTPASLATIEAGETAQAAALTTIHLQTVNNQIGLQLNKYDGMAINGAQEGLRGTADNLLDIIDIVQNDPALNVAAGGAGTPGHIGGFAEMPGGLVGTVTQFQDNQPQTNFWAAFLSESDVINNQLIAVANGAAPATADLVTEIQNFNNFGANFDAAQGPIFEGRFDNELMTGTLMTDTAAAVKGLTGILNNDAGPALAADHAMILAAGQGFVADANDVSGNNLPAGGGTYVPGALTVATATSVNNVAMGVIPVTATPDIANGMGAFASTASSSTPTTPTTPAGGTTTYPTTHTTDTTTDPTHTTAPVTPTTPAAPTTVATAPVVAATPPASTQGNDINDPLSMHHGDQRHTSTASTDTSHSDAGWMHDMVDSMHHAAHVDHGWHLG